MNLNFNERIFSLLCKKNIKWGDVKKKRMDDIELAHQQDMEWKAFWKRLKLDIPTFKNKIIVDYGSGFGYDSLFMLKGGASYVYCLEVTEDRLEACKKLHTLNGYTNAKYIDNKDVKSLVDKIGKDRVDIIICRDVMEHVPSPPDVLKSMYDILNKNGEAYIGFSPLYKSPYGPHISTYCKVPYVHLLFSEETIINVLKKLYHIPENTYRYLDIPGSGVNKLSYFNYLSYLSSINWKTEINVKNSFPNRPILAKMLNAGVSIVPSNSLKELLIVNSYVKVVK